MWPLGFSYLNFFIAAEKLADTNYNGGKTKNPYPGLGNNQATEKARQTHAYQNNETKILSHDNMPRSKRSVSQRGVGLRKEHNQNKNVIYIGGYEGQDTGDD